MKTALLATLIMSCAAATSGEPAAAADEIIVRFAPGTTAEERDMAVELAGGVALQRDLGQDFAVIKTPLMTRDVVREAMTTLPQVVSAELDYFGYGGGEVSQPNDPRFEAQWHLRADEPANIDILGAWEVTRGSSEIKVAVLDSGLLMDQPEFTNRIAQHAGEWANGIDDDGNGYVDDIDGWDFVDADTDPFDEHGHGSVVASIMGANSNDAFGVAGIDPSAQVMPLRILDAENRGRTSDLIEALYYAADRGADVINLSLVGYAMTDSLTAALDDVTTRAIVVSCAGNSGAGTADVLFPAAHPGTIAVGATNEFDELASYSSTGQMVDLVAPGDRVVAADVAPPYNPVDSSVRSGCSMATPVVAGVVSLMKAVDPSLTLDQVLDILSVTAVDLGEPGWDPMYGAGRVDAGAALRETQRRLTEESPMFANGFE